MRLDVGIFRRLQSGSWVTRTLKPLCIYAPDSLQETIDPHSERALTKETCQEVKNVLAEHDGRCYYQRCDTPVVQLTYCSSDQRIKM